MRQWLIYAASFVILISLQPMISYAHGDEKHEEGTAHSDEKVQTKAQAIKSIEDGIVLMASTISDQNREEMFNDGPIMQTWHAKSTAIEEAMESIRKNIMAWEDSKKRRIEGAMKQLSKIMDDFHSATHKHDTKGAKTAVKKAEGSLKLLKVYLK